MKINIAEQDIIFLSYDEPNCEKNYVELMMTTNLVGAVTLMLTD